MSLRTQEKVGVDRTVFRAIEQFKIPEDCLSFEDSPGGNSPNPFTSDLVRKAQEARLALLVAQAQEAFGVPLCLYAPDSPRP